MIATIITLTKNVNKYIGKQLISISDLFGELLVDDEGSTDGTIEIIRKYGGKVFSSHGMNLGQRKQGLIDRAKGDWILILDADERVSDELREEIKKIVRGYRIGVWDDSRNNKPDSRRSLPRTSLRGGNDPSTALRVNGYRIPYQNHVFGKPVYFGGENYSKVRLFRRGKGRVSSKALHEEVMVDGKIGRLEGKILHHSYRTPVQLFTKFTKYAWIAAGEKRKAGERVTTQKLFLYGPHMFWARFIQDEGYKDGLHGFILAFAFAYMETLTYWFIYVKHN